MKSKKTRRWLILGVSLFLLVIVGCFGKPTFLWVNAWFHDNPRADKLPPGIVDDASRLNRTQVSEVWSIPSDRTAAENQLRELLLRAKAERKPIAIAGARHTMGGHTIYADGIALNMLPFNHMELDDSGAILRVGAGARWSEVIPFLDARGLSVAIMQSNNNFSVDGSLSVNCHGWQHNKPPIASTVEAIRVMKADRTIVRCTRTENSELFSLVLGGYGLFGIILDAELRVVPNERYQPHVEVFPAILYNVRFTERVNGIHGRKPDAGMVYGRLRVLPGDGFLSEAILTVFRKAPCPREEIPELKSLGYETLRREIYRAQIGSDAGKEVRWKTELMVSKQIASKFFSRNQLINEPAETYQEQNADRTDILHEYFIPTQKIHAFLTRARTIIPKHHGDLLNVTIRNVMEDKDTVLRYADQEMFAFVMLFNQRRSKDADAQMEAMTQELIEAALECQGRYYLPYRLHGTRDQFLRAYPKAALFFELKRFWDPDGLFQNQFYVKYGGK